MIERMSWSDLPFDLRDAIVRKTGGVLESRIIESGLNCSVALMIRTALCGGLFLKGVRTSDRSGVEGLRNEEKINGVVAGLSPVIRHTFEVAGWYCLAFVYIDGRHAELGPGTHDLPAIQWVMTQKTLACGRPRVLAPLELPQLVDRYRNFLTAEEAALLHGTSLLHTDTNPHNLLIAGDGSAYLIDWAMPALGPKWVDVADTAVRLMECGLEPAEAINWLSYFTGWQTANPRAVEAYVNARCRQWSAWMGEEKAASSNGRFRQLLGYPHRKPRPMPKPRASPAS
ncbi:phosphotransferase [Streptomyces sp. NPDC048717]|uniref:phosphotransferase n=1 Tax=Streptomyces sp. NPDC048717 TaxID=3154928 RepID=UPI0034348092